MNDIRFYASGECIGWSSLLGFSAVPAAWPVQSRENMLYLLRSQAVSLYEGKCWLSAEVSKFPLLKKSPGETFVWLSCSLASLLGLCWSNSACGTATLRMQTLGPASTFPRMPPAMTLSQLPQDAQSTCENRVHAALARSWYLSFQNVLLHLLTSLWDPCGRSACWVHDLG